jgi:hypothetical protein
VRYDIENTVSKACMNPPGMTDIGTTLELFALHLILCLSYYFDYCRIDFFLMSRASRNVGDLGIAEQMLLVVVSTIVVSS